MPAAPLIIAGAAVVGAGAAVVGTAKSISAQNKAAAAQKKQFAYERQAQRNASVRERRDAIRAARLTGGALVQAGENQGASESSAAMGGLGSIQTQLNSNLSFLDTQTSLANRGTEQSVIARSQQSKAQNWGAVSSLGMQVFGVAAGKL